MQYASHKIVRDGEKFDSAKEYRRWMQLKAMEEAGEISDLQRQPRFELIPTQRIDGRVVERPVYYTADFSYTEDGKQVVEDVKGKGQGCRARDYILRRKLMLYLLGIRIKETEVSG